jgi:hypothetical protein
MTLELDLEGPEARVPTRLVDRPRRSAGRPPGSDVLFAVGPYSVSEGLVRAPGAWIVRARDPNGEEALLQLAHLRPLKSAAERAVRAHVEQTLLARTTALLDEHDRVVLAHGGVDRIDGTRVLFWAMPLPERAHRLGNPLKHLASLDHLLAAGTAIARRIARRHELGRFEPLLSEQLFLITEEDAELIGVPVGVPSDWLADDMPSPRIAPEEAAAGHSTVFGDVWRLGQALSVLAAGFEPLPPELRDLLGRLTAQSSSARPQRASEVVVELDAVRRSIDASARVSEGATVAMTIALSHEEVTDLVLRSMGESTHVEAQTAVSDEPVPPWAFFFEPEDYRIFEATMQEVAPPDLTDADCAELARLCRGQASDRWALLIRTYLAIEADTLFGSAIPDATIADAPLSFEEDTLVPSATIVDGALDPAEVAETRTVAPLVYVPEPIPTGAFGNDESSVEIELPIAEVVKAVEPEGRRSRRRWMLGSLLVLALLGAFAFAAGRPGDAAVAPADHGVVIETGTPNALIVREDGTVLGPGPVTIAVPEGGEIAVLIAAIDHRPERIVLPTGGKLRVSLDPLPEDPKRCSFEVPSGATFEGIAAELDGTTVRGAAVVRTHDGSTTRASIVRCEG